MNRAASRLAFLAVFLALLLFAVDVQASAPPPPRYPEEIYHEDAVFTCGPLESADHVNPCIKYGPGLYPHGEWLPNYKFANGAQTYIQCGEGGASDCHVRNTADGTVWNPYIGGQAHDCDVLPLCKANPNINRPGFNTCLLSTSGVYDGKPTYYLPFDLEAFCYGIPYWMMEGPAPPAQSQQSPEGLEIPEEIMDYTKFIQCDDFGGCFVRKCSDGTEWSQEKQTCVFEKEH